MNTTPSVAPYTSWHGTEFPAALKPLTSEDLGGGKVASSLKPLTYADFVPGSKTATKSEHEQLVTQTQKWVSQTFYGTILKQMHDSPFRSEIFEGGRGGQAFSGLFDQRMAEHMSKGAGNKLVKNIVRRIEARKAYAQQAKDAGIAPASATDEINAGKIKKEGGDRVEAALRA